MPNNMIHWPIVVTRRAAAEPTGVVIRYRGVRSNNNDIHAVLVERFEQSTLHKLSYDDLLRDVRDYTGVPDFTANIPDNHESASGVSVDPQVQGLVERIRDLTRKYLLTSAAPSSGAASPK